MKLIKKHPVISAGPFVSSTYFACSSLNGRLYSYMIKNTWPLPYVSTRCKNNSKKNSEESRKSHFKRPNAEDVSNGRNVV